MPAVVLIANFSRSAVLPGFRACGKANDKNIASCLRLICLKYLNVYACGMPAADSDRAARERAAPAR